MPFHDFPSPPRADAAAAHYELLADGLRRAGYSLDACQEYLGVPNLADFFEGHAKLELETLIDSPISALVQVFLLGRAVEAALLEAQLGEAFVGACRETGLLLASDAAPTALVASAALYPFAGAAIASDRVTPLPGLEDQPQPDVVYPACTRSAQLFLGLLPRRPVGRFLEVCGGCGPAALLAAQFCGESTASDLEPRSAAFAAFNGRLLGVGNFRSIAGAYYQGTEGLYDLIAAHPPYMPSLGSTHTYYGGGNDGTEIVRGLLAQLPEKLSPGGLFYAVAMLPQGAAATVEQNVRAWIGQQAPHFDVFFFPQTTSSIHQLALSIAVKNKGGIPVVTQYEQALRGLGHREFLMGALLVRRHVGAEDPVDTRRKLAPRSDWEELQWCVDFAVVLKQPQIAQQLLEDSPRIRPEFELHATHKPSPEGLPPVRFQAVTAYPFAMETEIQAWMSYLLARADGTRTGQQLLESLIDDQVVHPETSAEKFAQLLGVLIAGGFLESSICPLPVAAE
ncbi:MAG: hypothetical protein MUF01_08655 [Bryobacterales bacterium]|nr:hypothetical protein [Bryobacterales bacterium]